MIISISHLAAIGGQARTCANLLAVFLIGGLWHGAAWTFVFWGFLHGCAIVVHRIWQNFGLKMHKILAWFITFNFINIAWVFFRAKEWDDAIKVLKGMSAQNGIMFPNALADKLSFLQNFGINFGNFLINVTPSDARWLISYVFISFFIVLFFKNSCQNFLVKFSLKSLIFAVFLFTAALLSMNKISEFLYFNF